MDMTKSIEPKSDQMNFEDFIPSGPEGARTFTITDVREGNAEQPFWFYLAEFHSDKPFKPAKTVRKLMVLAWGRDPVKYIGKRMTLYGDPDVMWAGKKVGGIRVSHMSGIGLRPVSMPLSVSQGRRVMYEVQPLPDVAPPPAAAAPVANPLADLAAAFTKRAIMDPDARLAYCADVIERPLTDPRALTPDEIDMVIDALGRVQS